MEQRALLACLEGCSLVKHYIGSQRALGLSVVPARARARRQLAVVQ